MVRQGYYTNPSEKKIEIFDNFTGGMNTVTTNSSLSDTELVYLENADLDARGDITRRLGMESHLVPSVSGKGQGYFRYYRTSSIVRKNFVKPFTDSSWVLLNGAVSTVRTSDILTFNSTYSSGVNVVYTFDPVDVAEIKGKQVTVSILEYSMTSSDGLAPFSVKTLANSTWNTLATVFADSGNTANRTVTFTVPADATELKFEVHRDTSSADGQPITIKQMQLEIGAVATGYVPYVSPAATMIDEIVAINGKLYKNGVELPITGLASFQTTRKIEAVQFQTSLYIATGTKLVEYDGTTAKVVDPYKPVGQEALYVGFNALFPDPANYATDSTNTFNSIDTVLFNKRYGVINTKITTTIITTKIAADTLEYKTEVALPNAPTTFVIVKDWATAATGKTVDYTPTMVGDYAFRFTIRKTGTTGQDIVYNVPKYTVNQTDQNTTLSVSSMQTCNRIFVHNDRLCLYGDESQTNQLYFSHLNKPRYFPVNNTIDFKSDRQEGITAVVKYRNILVAFTPSNIQALYGSSPADFVKKTINSSVGCIAPYSATVVENYVNFVSKEGIFALVSTGTVDDRMNVRRLDENIWNVVPKSTDCVGVYFNKQYQLVYPTEKIRFRFYTQMGVWTQDKSSKMTLGYLAEWDGILIGQRSDVGDIVKFDPSSEVVTDLGEVYKFAIETKLFDFGVPYHIKKLKQIQIQMKVQGMTSNLRVYVSADNKLVVNPDKTDIIVNNQGNVEWVVSSNPNFEIDAGTILGSWVMGKSAFGTPDNKVNKIQVSGKCRSTKIRIEQTENLPCGFLGVAYIFKLRKPK